MPISRVWAAARFAGVDFRDQRFEGCGSDLGIDGWVGLLCGDRDCGEDQDRGESCHRV
jgi:hypothetical protein